MQSIGGSISAKLVRCWVCDGEGRRIYSEILRSNETVKAEADAASASSSKRVSSSNRNTFPFLRNKPPPVAALRTQLLIVIDEREYGESHGFSAYWSLSPWSTNNQRLILLCIDIAPACSKLPNMSLKLLNQVSNLELLDSNAN